MASTALTSFLRTLNVDPGLLAAFEADPKAVLSTTRLSEDDKSALLSADRYRLLQSLQGDFAAAPQL
jgi:hypothetical protein